MQVRLSSGNYDILDHGNVYLFDEKSDLTLNLNFSPTFEVYLTICFVTALDREQEITTKVEENHVFMECVNFIDNGTGLSVPVEIAIFNGKKIYFTFWSYLEGSNDKKRARKVEYTIFCEK